VFIQIFKIRQEGKSFLKNKKAANERELFVSDHILSFLFFILKKNTVFFIFLETCQ